MESSVFNQMDQFAPDNNPLAHPLHPVLGTERVSVVIPCFNEERFIAKVLENLADQYDPERYEIVVVDGMSEDSTRRIIAEFCQSHPQILVRLVDNPARNIPRALNLGIAAAQGEIIARMDAHAVASPGYIRRCVAVLQENAEAIVGAPCRVCPGANTLTAQAIAIAVSHPFGIGDAKYRLREGKELQEPVDTVAFACFRKRLWEELGGYNEQLLTNEDYDFNYRARARGRQVLLDRAEHCDYFARATLSTLAAQYFRYGGWKARMVTLHPQSIKLRHLIAPGFVLSLVLLAAGGAWFGFLWWLLAVELTCYFLCALACGWQVRRRANTGMLVLLMPIVFFTVHLVWGTGFLLGLMRTPR
jgi:glycosyltransferase involved in cell wall biosynthesis